MKSNDISLAKFGNHFSFIYKNEEQLFLVLIPFFIEGLMNNQKCVWITDIISKKNIVAEFSQRNVDMMKFIKSGQLLIAASEDIYLSNGYFDPESTISSLKQSEQQTLSEGYTGLRIVGEATGILKGKNGRKKLMEYEISLGNFFPGSKVIAICLYNEENIEPNLLAESMHCHPELIFYDKLCDNLYYSPSQSADKSKPLPVGSYELMKEDFVNK
ncbi:MAG: MEDS domain-containing protein [archaeon]